MRAARYERDSVQVDEPRHPVRVAALRLVQDSTGNGRQRGAPAQEIECVAVGNDVTAVTSGDGQHAPPRGVLGGLPGTLGATWLASAGAAERLPNAMTVTLRQGEARVLHKGWESRGPADAVYGVRFTAATEDDRLAVDAAATEARRAELRAAR